MLQWGGTECSAHITSKEGKGTSLIIRLRVPVSKKARRVPELPTQRVKFKPRRTACTERSERHCQQADTHPHPFPLWPWAQRLILVIQMNHTVTPRHSTAVWHNSKACEPMPPGQACWAQDSVQDTVQDSIQDTVQDSASKTPSRTHRPARSQTDVTLP